MTPLSLVKTRSAFALDNGLDIGSWTLESPTSVGGGSYRGSYRGSVGASGGGGGGEDGGGGGGGGDDDGDMLEPPLVMTPRTSYAADDANDLALFTSSLGGGNDTERELLGEPVDLIA